MKKQIISSLPPLAPHTVTDLSTGEVIGAPEHDAAIEALIKYIQKEVEATYKSRGRELEEKISKESAIKFGSAFARNNGYVLDYSQTNRLVKAKSRIAMLYQHKLISEVFSYVNNPNPKKQPPNFGPKINLGAVDKQMASLSVEENQLTLEFRAWDRHLLLEFTIPAYILSRDVVKYSLPTIELIKGKPVYRFAITEKTRIRKSSSNNAGIDLGRVEPFTMAIVNGEGALVANYRANGFVKQLGAKRERLIKERGYILKKANHYDALGIDSSNLREEASLKRSKVSLLSAEVARQVGADIAKKLARHQLNTLAMEDLSWVQGAKYGGRWAHSVTQGAIEHAVSRDGIRVEKVNPRGTSQECSACGGVLVHNSKTRIARCSECKSKFDRDFNAALNIARRLRCYPNRYSRIGDICREDGLKTSSQDIDFGHNSSLRNASFVT